jgi:2-keto-4-pentenoate hydratase/2-oxohepta-3-ene-1,7-dioic acid hydratase in catechol pathway
MRLGSFMRGGEEHLGLQVGDRVLSLTEVGRNEAGYGRLRGARDATALWSDAAEDLRAVARKVESEGIPAAWRGSTVAESECAWLPPVLRPEKIICIGLNYRDHAAESKMEVPKEPVIFNKFNNALVGAAGPVILPVNSSQVDYEAELAVVLGKKARHVPAEQAMDCVGGYTLMHDVSARDWQFRTGQWVSGKTFDTFGPCGPVLVTPDEVPDPHSLDIRLTLNGAVMQQSNTRNLIFNIPTLISYISEMVTLVPGDIISTGTPPGVGFARRPQVFLGDGDTVEIWVERVGTMRHRCVAEARARQQSA